LASLNLKRTQSITKPQ